jgi:hypothetical protein
VPEGFRAADTVLTGLAGTPWRYEVTVSVHGPADQVRSHLPRGLAVVTDGGEGRAVVRLRAERLDWLPAVLAGLGRPFVIHEPPELREAVRAWATRIAAYATAEALPKAATGCPAGLGDITPVP